MRVGGEGPEWRGQKFPDTPAMGKGEGGAGAGEEACA